MIRRRFIYSSSISIEAMTKPKKLKTFTRSCAKNISHLSISGPTISSFFLKCAKRILMLSPSLKQFYNEPCGLCKRQATSIWSRSSACSNSNLDSQRMEEQCLRELFLTTQREWIYGRYTWTWRWNTAVETKYKQDTCLRDVYHCLT